MIVADLISELQRLPSHLSVEIRIQDTEQGTAEWTPVIGVQIRNIPLGGNGGNIAELILKE